MNPELLGYADAVLPAPGSERAATVADELAAVWELVRGSDRLVSVLTDTSLRPAQRRAILDDLLAERVSTEVRRVEAFAAGVVPAPEVPTALDWLTRRAVEGEEAELVASGRQAARARVGGYATALFEDAQVSDLEELEDELFRFARTVEATPALGGALANRDLPVAVRQAVVDDLLRDRVSERARRLVGYVVRAGRSRDVVGTLDWLVERTAEARGWRLARVRAAREIDRAQQDRLAEAIGRLTGSSVELQVTVDPDLLGGAVVEIGDLQVDASAEGRLEHLREHLDPETWTGQLRAAVEPAGAGRPGGSGHVEPDGTVGSGGGG